MKVLQAPIVKTIPFSWVDGPGNRFVIFTQGCNFNCIPCHNPQTIPLHTARATDRSVDSLLEEIKTALPFITGVTISGGEATLHDEFIFELFTKLHEDHETETLTRFIDSNGNATIEQWEKLLQVTDGVMLDLKAFDENKHIALTEQSNKAVLDSIKYLNQQGILYEVRLLLIPGINDSDEELLQIANFLLAINPEMQIRVNAFSNHGVRASAKDCQPATAKDVAHYIQILRSCGVSRIFSQTIKES